MIDTKKAREEIINHVEEQKIESPRVSKKISHIMRVSEISKKIATNLELEEEQVQLAELIGILHDIGRFEQYKRLDKTKKFNHGEAGVEILRKDNYIRKYIREDTYDDIIYTAIYEHNRYELTQGLTKEKELFCKIIKDADKIDLIYEAIVAYWQEPKAIEEIEKGRLSKRMLEDFYQQKLADNKNSMSAIDQILKFASFVFDLNFSYSFKVLKENNHVSQMIDRFDYKLPNTKKEMIRIRNIANEYIEEKSFTKK